LQQKTFRKSVGEPFALFPDYGTTDVHGVGEGAPPEKVPMGWNMFIATKDHKSPQRRHAAPFFAE